MIAGACTVPAPHGRLEAIHRPGTDESRAALVLHPHPLHGGTMHNPVVFHAERALREAGFSTLRVNFRGVGASTGRHDGGPGEVDDARTALDFLLAEHPRATDVVVAGFSFGAAIALALAKRDPRVGRTIAIGTPVGLLEPGALAGDGRPRLFVHGERDDVAPIAALRQALPESDPSTSLHVVGGGSHFFDGDEDELRDAIAGFVAT